jgi:hypothetical protein
MDMCHLQSMPWLHCQVVSICKSSALQHQGSQENCDILASLQKPTPSSRTPLVVSQSTQILVIPLMWAEALVTFSFPHLSGPPWKQTTCTCIGCNAPHVMHELPKKLAQATYSGPRFKKKMQSCAHRFIFLNLVAPKGSCVPCCKVEMYKGSVSTGRSRDASTNI